MKNNTIKLPLYKEANEDKTLLRGLQQNGNAGLWYDKFCNTWKGLAIIDRQKNGKVEIKKCKDKNGDGWIETVANQSCGNGNELKRQWLRRWEMVAKLKGHNLCLKTDSPFVTGLGREHPVENGFLWHHTLGVPYLPGSSVKGMVRSWIEQWAEEKDKKEKEEIDRIFGPKQPTEQPQVGVVVFLDAIPLDTVRLKADIMTPHYGEYYQNKERPKAPGDWISPVPIPFLAVKEGATFHFAIVPRRHPCLKTQGESGKSSDLPVGKSREGNHRADCEIVVDWLKEALEWIGAGAKTAIGYGRMSVDDSNQDRCEKEWREQKQKAKDAKKRDAELAKASPIEREILEFLAKKPDKGIPDHTVIINQVKSGRWEGKEKVEVARWLKRKMEEEKRWKPNTKAKKPDKDRDYQNTLLIMKWLQGE